MKLRQIEQASPYFGLSPRKTNSKSSRHGYRRRPRSGDWPPRGWAREHGLQPVERHADLDAATTTEDEHGSDDKKVMHIYIYIALYIYIYIYKYRYISDDDAAAGT